MPEENILEVTEGNDSQQNGASLQNPQPEDNTDSNNAGETVTFEDIINHPDYKEQYQKAVDRAVSKAINSYKANHDVDVEKLIKEKVAEQVNAVKFDATLKESLIKSGVIDNVALIAHLDLNDLKGKYDPNKGTIEGLEETIENAKKTMPYLFKQEGTNTTGQPQTKFGTDKNAPTDLRSALAMKYGK